MINPTQKNSLLLFLLTLFFFAVIAVVIGSAFSVLPDSARHVYSPGYNYFFETGWQNAQPEAAAAKKTSELHYTLFDYEFSDRYLALNCIFFSLVYALGGMSINLLSANYKLAPSQKVLLVFGSFFAGYALITGVSSLLAPFFTNKQLNISLFVLLFFGAIQTSIALKSVTLSDVKSWLVPVGGCLGSFCVIFILNIQVEATHILGDADVTRFNKLFENNSFNPDSHFPTILGASDKFLFLRAPLALANELSLTPNYLLSYLLLSTAIKHSICMLIIFIFSKFTSLFNSLLVALYIFFGNYFIVPLAPRHIFDQANGLIVSLEPGRDIQNYIPFIVLCLAFFYSSATTSQISEKKFPKLRGILVFMMGVGTSNFGLAALPVFLGTLLILVGYQLIGVASLCGVKSGFKAEIKLKFMALLGLSTLILASLPYSNSGFLFLAVLACLIILLLRLVVVDFGLQLSNFVFAKPVILMWVIFFGFVLGLVSSNVQLFSSFQNDPLILDFTKYSFKEIFALGSANDVITANQFCPSFISGYCKHWTNTLALYGLPFVLVALALFFHKFINDNRLIEERENQNLIVLTLLALLIAMSASFFLFHYFNGRMVGSDDWLKIWVKIRLLEPWYYSALLFSFLYFLMPADFKSRLLTLFLLLSLVADPVNDLNKTVWHQFFLNLTSLSAYVS